MNHKSRVKVSLFHCCCHSIRDLQHFVSAVKSIPDSFPSHFELTLYKLYFRFHCVGRTLNFSKWLCMLFAAEILRDVLFVVRACSDIIKTDRLHNKRTTFSAKTRVVIKLEKHE